MRERFIIPPRPAAFRFEARPAVVGGVRRAGVLHGWPILYNLVSSDRGGYRVRIKPGAVRFTREVHALLHHQFDRVIGTTANQTLRLFPEPRGVRCEIDVADTCEGRDAVELVRRRDIRGMSFAISNEPTFTERVEDGLRVRDYTSLICDEVTVTPIPAFIETSVTVAGSTPEPLGYSRSRTPARTAAALKLERFRFGAMRLRPPVHS